jgi:hypothetical protein
MSTMARKTAHKWLWFHIGLVGKTFSKRDDRPVEARIASFPE